MPYLTAGPGRLKKGRSRFLRAHRVESSPASPPRPNQPAHVFRAWLGERTPLSLTVPENRHHSYRRHRGGAAYLTYVFVVMT